MIKQKKKSNHFNILFFSMFKFCILLFLFSSLGSVFAFNQIDLNTYKNLKNIISKKINKNLYEKINIPSNIACNDFIQGDNYYISPGCFLQDKFPKLGVKQTSDLVFPFIQKFDNIYNLNAKKFTYKPSNVDFFYTYNLDNFISNTFIDKVELYVLSIKNYFIKVPKIFLAFKEFKYFSLYVSSKDLSKRNRGRLVNFNVAINTIDNHILQPQAELNFNKLIANRPGYYKKGVKKYLFYGGVCGASAMLFRNVLISPYLYTTKRYNHSQRYVNFYSPYIYGDDAGLYQYTKILKIKNISNYSIYFKEKRIGKEIYLVSIVPKKSLKISYVSKKQIGPLSARLSSIVFDKNANILYKQTWISNYKRKNYDN